MCLGAIYWAHLGNLYYGNTKTDAKEIGFDDSYIYDEINLPLNERRMKTTRHLSQEAIIAFEQWKDKENKIEY
jgi:tRNA(Arg) A34 adenosine deaminase TadA